MNRYLKWPLFKYKRVNPEKLDRDISSLNPWPYFPKTQKFGAQCIGLQTKLGPENHSFTTRWEVLPSFSSTNSGKKMHLGSAIKHGFV